MPRSRVHSLIFAIALALALVTSAIRAQGPSPEDPLPPDIVLIMLDDLDYTDVGAYQDLFSGMYGNLAITTPEIDALAANGLLFDQYYAMGPVCSPTRASMLSGRFPSHLGVRRAIPRDSYRGLPFDIELLPAMLQGEGYSTAHVGKWHLGFLKDGFLPTERGFDHSVRRIDGDYNDYEISIDDGPAQTFSTSNGDPHLTKYLTDRAIELFENAPTNQPLFLNVWYFAPHGPIQPPTGTCPPLGPPATAEDERLHQFACLVEYADTQIGRLLDAIADSELRNRENDTLVIFTSDNGGTVENHHTGARRYLRGNKTRVFEGGIRVPMIVRWPAGLDSTLVDAVDSTPVTSFDFFPTLADLAEDPSVDPGLKGSSFLDLLETGSPGTTVFDTRRLFWETKRDNAQPSPLPAIGNTFAVREEEYKYVYEDGVEYLFDIDSDPREQVDLASSDPTKLVELREHYFDWRAGSDIAYTTPVPVGNVTLVGDVLAFFEDSSGTGGYAEIGEVTYAGQPTVDPRLDFHDGDFSFTSRIVIDEDLVGEKGVIARKQGSWRLFVDAAGYLKLIVVAEDPNQGPAVLASASPLAVDEEIHVAFTVFAFRQDEQVIRLFVDGQQVAISTSEIDDVAPSDEPVRLGDNESLTAPFLGKIELPRMSVNALYPCEVEADAQGVPARDVCLI